MIRFGRYAAILLALLALTPACATVPKSFLVSDPPGFLQASPPFDLVRWKVAGCTRTMALDLVGDGKIDVRWVRNFGPEGQSLNLSADINDDGLIEARIEREYDEQGRLIRMIHYGHLEDQLVSERVFAYSPEGTKVTETVRPEHGPTSQNSESRQLLGRRVLITTDYGNDEEDEVINEVRFNRRGHLASLAYDIDADGHVDERFMYIADIQGRPARIEHHQGDEKIETFRIKYNKEGVMTDVKGTTPAGDLTATLHFTLDCPN